MGDKRDAAMAGLSWPSSERTTSNPRPTGSTDSDMIDDIGHESFAPPPPATLPTTISPVSPHYTQHTPSSAYNHHPDYIPYGPWTSSTTSGCRLLQDLGPGQPISRSLRRGDQPTRKCSPTRSGAFLLQAYRRPGTSQPDVRLLAFSLRPPFASRRYPTSSHLGFFNFAFNFAYNTINDPHCSETIGHSPFRCTGSWTTDRSRSSRGGHSPWHQHDWRFGDTWTISRPTSSPRDRPSRTEQTCLTHMYIASRIRLCFGHFAQLHILRKNPRLAGCVCGTSE